MSDVSHPEHHEALPEGTEEPPRGVRVMAIVRWVIVGLMALAAGLSIARHYGVFEQNAAASGKTYYCPMHPGVVQDHPGSCPICSMDLVEKPAKASDAPSATMAPNAPDAGAPVPGLTTVELSPERIQLMGMQTAVASEETLTPDLRTIGYVAANEQGLSMVHARFAGWIERLVADQTGAPVKRGQTLASIYSPDLLPPQQELLTALKWEKAPAGGPSSGQGLAEAARNRLRILGLSNEEIRTIERTGKTIRAVAVRSPATGYVTRKGAVEGLYVQPGTELFEIADLTKVWVLADVYEYEIGRVRSGQTASVTFASYPGEVFAGKVSLIAPTVDPESRTLRVRIELPNKGLRLKPGMYGEVRLALPSATALVVPVDALVDTGDQQYVFVAQPKGRFEPRRVKVGARLDGKVQILEGLAAGETVVTTANFLIDSESRLRAAIEGIGPTGEPKPAAAGGVCETDFDKRTQPDRYAQCRACEAHRGMGSMEADCRNAIPKPWK